ncbi:unnamed protein product [Boreogadus saida]
MEQYQTGCNTSDLQSEAEQEGRHINDKGRQCKNGSPSSSPSTPDINPEPAANRGAFFNPRHQTNMGGRMNESIPCSAAEVHILNLLETIKQQQDQLVTKVNYLCSRMNSTPGPDVEMPDNINLPLEHLEAVEAFEVFLKEPSNYPARQRVL